MPTKPKSHTRRDLLAGGKWPRGLSFLKEVQFRELATKQIGRRSYTLVTIEASKLQSLASAAQAAKRYRDALTTIKREFSKVSTEASNLRPEVTFLKSKLVDQETLNEELADVRKELFALTRERDRLQSEKSELEATNTQLMHIVEGKQVPSERSFFPASPLSKAPEKIKSSYPWPGGYGTGKKR